eukprot:TRINITY_DN6582_c0_g1_i1.p1 TRINITY_DN6582_c0_g1~~TRINITY_DN6582_c0_g1_i1.p1  ORF type:complete len:358 (+),score=42.08 TRINITY_DN6582_c0_g1_i1:97-1170(+)
MAPSYFSEGPPRPDQPFAGPIHSCVTSSYASVGNDVEAGDLGLAGTADSKRAHTTLAGISLLRAALSWGKNSPVATKDDDMCSSINNDTIHERFDAGDDFNVADCAEKGLAHESTKDFMEPLPRSRRLSRFRVLRSDDRLEHRLVTDEGAFLMLARISVAAHTVNFFMYDPAESHERPDLGKPAFSMTCNTSRSDWLLVQRQCENCHYVLPHLSCAALGGNQQVAAIQHSRRPEGHGISNDMSVRVPGIYSDGRRIVWCATRQKVSLARFADCDSRTQLLVNRRPAWNDKVGCLVLDFTGREVLASAKNLQLTLKQKPDHIICQHGKLSSSTFALDARFPLSIVQAFAIAMSTIFWT